MIAGDLNEWNGRERRARTVVRALGDATERLESSGSESPRLDAEVLLRHVLGLDRVGLFLRASERLADDDALAFGDLVERRAGGEPVAYLTGVREFMGLPFAVTRDVLVPRPETELLVEWALAWLVEHPAATIVDVGTGSGAIAVSLAAHATASWQGQVVASDVSATALAVAATNRANLLDAGRRARLRLVRGSLLQWCGGPVDLVLANLPYLTPDQIAANPALGAEPTLALEGGENGLRLIRSLVVDLHRVLASGGAAVLELDPSQADTVASWLRRRFPEAEVAVLPDLAGLARHVVLVR